MTTPTTIKPPNEVIEVGDYVRTIKGARFWGVVVALDNDFQNPGCTVKAIHPDFLGTKHVYPLAQVTNINTPPRDWLKLVSSTRAAISEPNLTLGVAVQLLQQWMEMHNVK